MTEQRKFWWHMDNGQQRRTLEFKVCARILGDAEERVVTMRAGNPPIYDHDPNSFSRFGYEEVKAFFNKEFGLGVGHIIRGEVQNGQSYRPCYVYAPGARVPFAVIIPSTFFKER